MRVNPGSKVDDVGFDVDVRRPVLSPLPVPTSVIDLVFDRSYILVVVVEVSCCARAMWLQRRPS